MTVRQTPISSLLWTAVVAVPVGWSIGRLVDAMTGALPRIPWGLPIILLLLAVSGFAGARMVRDWIRQRRYDRRVNAIRVARALALAKAAEYFSALMAGGYAGIAVLALSMLDVPMGRNRAVIAAATVLASIVLMVAAVRLERACKVPFPPPEDTDASPSAG